jgi:hypothetical protein
MSVEYREDRGKWGYRFYQRGQCYKKYAWETKTEAKEAERQAQVDAKNSPALQPTALITASGAYLIASAEGGRGQWRLDGLRYVFNAHIIPHFGEAALITDITQKMIENFIAAETQRIEEQNYQEHHHRLAGDVSLGDGTPRRRRARSPG